LPVRRRRDRGDETQGEAFASQRARTCIKIQPLVNPKNIPEFKWIIVVPLRMRAQNVWRASVVSASATASRAYHGKMLSGAFSVTTEFLRVLARRIAQKATSFLSLKTVVDTATNLRAVVGHDAVLEDERSGIEDAAALVDCRVTEDLEDLTANDLDLDRTEIKDAAALRREIPKSVGSGVIGRLSLSARDSRLTSPATRYQQLVAVSCGSMFARAEG
jgi:hypothetical protein